MSVLTALSGLGFLAFLGRRIYDCEACFLAEKGQFSFRGGVNGGLSDMTLSKYLRSSMGVDATVHGFRASFKTWAEQETDHANNVIEAALAHIVGDKAERAYMRGDWLAKRRALMKDWADYCSLKPVQTVVTLSRQRMSA